MGVADPLAKKDELAVWDLCGSDTRCSCSEDETDEEELVMKLDALRSTAGGGVGGRLLKGLPKNALVFFPTWGAFGSKIGDGRGEIIFGLDVASAFMKSSAGSGEAALESGGESSEPEILWESNCTGVGRRSQVSKVALSAARRKGDESGMAAAL